VRAERQIIFHGRYFQEFYIKADDKLKAKIGYVFRIVKTVDNVSEKFLKHLEGTDSLYEIRIEPGANIYRIFCCFDKGSLVVLLNAFQKKTQKIPKQEIDLAEQLNSTLTGY
jgi:phage-related protein